MDNNTRQPLSFWKTTWASALGVIIAGAVLSVVGFFLMMGLLVGMLTGLDSETQYAAIQNDTYLTVDLTRPVSEVSPSALETAFGETSPLGADRLLEAIREAAKDDNVRGLYFTVGGSSGLSWGLAEELRQALIDFRDEGKAVVFYGETYSQPEYYLASVSTKLCLHPDDMLDLRGIGAEVMYYKDLFDKLGVSVDLIRPASCTYKSAGETYTMNHMSEANREQIRQYINSIWEHVSYQICLWRQLDSEASFNNLVASLGGCLPKEALAAGLVDTLCFKNDCTHRLKDFGSHFVPITQYQPASSHSAHQVALIYCTGTVQVGKYPGYGDGIYADRTVRAIAKAANDSKVKAIVLRVNSPGGAVTTSQAITDAVRKAREKKPVVVSMSDVAASAGYEISSQAHYIVAQPTTITGSIGVFGTVPEVGQMLKKKLGLTFDTVSTHRNSSGLSLVRPMSTDARAMMQRNVDEFYTTFVQTVADGRRLEYRYVDSIARGRVWTGRDAYHLGLVDTLGGLPLAMEKAAQLAGVQDYRVKVFPAAQSWSEQLSALFGDGTEETHPITLGRLMRAKRMVSPLPIEQQIEADLRALSEQPTMQARLPYSLILN